MIARLGPSNILHKHGSAILTDVKANRFSWFWQVEQLSEQYSLPHPLQVLQNPPTKESFKRLTKSKVTDWWNENLRQKVASLDSLVHFRSNFMSLANPHPLWTSAKSSPYEIRKATVQARMLSGRYRTCWLRRHWSGDTSGMCRIPGCTGEPGTLQHIVARECPGLVNAYSRATALWSSFLRDNPLLLPTISSFSLADHPTFLSFLLDPSTLAPVISLAQIHGKEIIDQLCYLARTWLYCVHKERLKLMNLWT